MESSEIVWARETLFYTEVWLELGVLTNEIAQVQKQAWSEENADQNTEHYRYGAWRTYWWPKKSITDRDLERCLALATSDPDWGMGGAILHDVLLTDWLSDKQFHLASQKFRVFRKELDLPNTEKIIERQALYRSLNEVSSPSRLASVVREGDSKIQRYVIDKFSLDHATLLYLESHGLVKAVRNIARVKLRKFK